MRHYMTCSIVGITHLISTKIPPTCNLHSSHILVFNPQNTSKINKIQSVPLRNSPSGVSFLLINTDIYFYFSHLSFSPRNLGQSSCLPPLFFKHPSSPRLSKDEELSLMGNPFHLVVLQHFQERQDNLRFICHSESVHTGVKVTHFPEMCWFQWLSLWSSPTPFFSLLNLYFHGKHEVMALRMIQIAFQKKEKTEDTLLLTPHRYAHTHKNVCTHTHPYSQD